MIILNIEWCVQKSGHNPYGGKNATAASGQWGVFLAPIGQGILRWDKEGVIRALSFGLPHLEGDSRYGDVRMRCDKQAQAFHGRLGQSDSSLRIRVEGSEAALQVYRYVRFIPSGETRSYGHVACAIGWGSQGARAVGRALGANKLAWIIPCHRVVCKNGSYGGYRWGVELKQSLLQAEIDDNKTSPHILQTAM